MKATVLKSTAALLLAASVLFSSGSVCASATGTASDFPQLTKKQSLRPTSVPIPTEPVVSAPEETESTETRPVVTVPEVSAALPDTTQTREPVMTDTAPQSQVFFGLLHAHSSLSSGTGTPEEVFQFASLLENLDFFAITDRSESFDNWELGHLSQDAGAVSSDWASGKAAAAAVTGEDFVGIFGHEMAWPAQMQLGHISVFGTPGFQSWNQEPYHKHKGALEQYYHDLSAVSGSVGQFNHPGKQYGTFSGFAHHTPEIDQVMTLLEISFEDKDPCRYYTKALDLGWHLSPTAGQSIQHGSWEDQGIRTAVCGSDLTESNLLETFSACRTYATADPDLTILYSMDGHPMGSRLTRQDTGERADITVSLTDPSDSGIGLVEVISCGGAVTAQQELSSASGTLSFSLDAVPGYYFLRITQPDGDLAVTAPIWIDAEEALGITDFSCKTAVPVQNEPVTLSLEVSNGDTSDFLVESLTLLADGIPVDTEYTLTQIPANSTRACDLSFCCDCAGLTDITLKLTGTLKDSPRSYEASLPLRFHQSSQVTGIVADSSHGNAGLDSLTILKALAAEENIRLTVADAGISPEILKDCRFLLISAPSVPFSSEFLTAVADYAGYGGSIVLCGQADSLDTDIHSAAELNRLLEAIGASLRIQDDTARDPVNNNGTDTHINTKTMNTALPWCAGLSGKQLYRAAPGCSVDPGSGTWLVQGRSTTESTDGDQDGLGGTAPGNVTLMACEALSGGGTVFAAGSLFLADENMAPAKNIWDEPYANRNIARNLLGIGACPTPLSSISDARTAPAGALIRVQGYVTAGTSNPYNTFPETLYLQDETGGIAVVPFRDSGIQQGTPLEITGYAGAQNGNPVLKLSSWKTLADPMYQYLPAEGDWKALLDPVKNGGRLVQVEGKCLEIYCREDGTLAGCLLDDTQGNQAQIKIEDCIFAGSDGSNALHKVIRKGRTVRAMGILHIDTYGDPVIRVRNCEEVVYVPPLKLFSLNPKTADTQLPVSLCAMLFSLSGLLLIKKRRKS